jgi:hypothetical protein
MMFLSILSGKYDLDDVLINLIQTSIYIFSSGMPAMMTPDAKGPAARQFAPHPVDVKGPGRTWPVHLLGDLLASNPNVSFTKSVEKQSVSQSVLII